MHLPRVYVDEEQTISEVKRLLALYPGVTVFAVWRRDYATRLVLQVTDAEPLARLVRCAMGANVPTHVWMSGPGRLDEARADPANLRYEFPVPNPTRGDDPPTPLQYLGIYMAWDLAADGTLDRDSANKLLDEWGAATV